MSKPKTEKGYHENNLGVRVLTPFSPKDYKRILTDELKQGYEYLIFYMSLYGKIFYQILLLVLWLLFWY